MGDWLVPSPHNRMNKAITKARQGFEKTRRFRIVMQGGAELMDGGIEAAFKVNGSAFRPHPPAQRVAGDQLAGCF